MFDAAPSHPWVQAAPLGLARIDMHRSLNGAKDHHPECSFLQGPQTALMISDFKYTA